MRKEAFYPFLFSALTFLGTTACSASQNSKPLETNISASGDAGGVDRDLEKFLNNPGYRMIYDGLREKNLGMVVVTLENLPSDLRLRMTRVDASSGNEDLDKQEMLVESPLATDNFFAASSCTGKYMIEVSADGVNYDVIQVPDLHTRRQSDSFELRSSSCSRPIRVIFPGIPQI